MKINKLDDIEFRLQESHDFTWLKRYGTAFWAVDETGSGCVCIGMQKADKRFFCKIAGVNTLEADVSPEESVQILKQAVSIYRDLEHPNLIKLVEAYNYEKFYIAVFEWADGECLFDHWNFEKYQSNPSVKSPKQRFGELSIHKKMKCADVLFSFLQNVNEKGYVAVDFYDGSIMYDFENDVTTICDIDFFRKAPVVNDLGEDWFGSKRLKAPEEYAKGSKIDERTNVFTLGALLFEVFGSFSEEEIGRRYMENRFRPCDIMEWQLDEASYRVAVKAVSQERDERYKTIAEFHGAWNTSKKC